MVARVRRASVRRAQHRQDETEVRELCIAGHTMVVAAVERGPRMGGMESHMAAVQVVWVAVVRVKALYSLYSPLQARQTRAVAEVRPLTLWEHRADRVS